jgi:CDP-4-dehydro-6-deoxyglucose reductase
MSFSVNVEPSGHHFIVEAGEAILDAALKQGITLPYGCRNGACGSCLGQLQSGEVTYPNGTPRALTPEAKAEGKAIFCQAHAASDLVIEVREPAEEKEIQVKTMPSRIEVMERINHDVMLLKLKIPETERMQFLAGQYIQILLKDGRERSFSLANAPHEDGFLELHIRHVDGGDFTSEVFDKMKIKDILRIEGPHGQFYLREDSTRPIIFMAGGTGFAPIRGIIEHALAADCQRPMHLYWGARAKEDLYHDVVAQAYADEHEQIQYTAVLSEAKDSDNWMGRTGYAHTAIMQDYPDLSAYEIYAAGPPVMVYAGRDHFPENQFKLKNYYSDAFEFQK